MAEGYLDDFLGTYAVIPAREAARFGTLLQGDFSAIPALIVPTLMAMFLHGGFLHLGGNMLFLWIFGDNVEDLTGPVRFTVFYLLCGAAATAAQIVLDPVSMVPNIGASGAIAGVLAAYLINYPRAKVQTVVPLGFIFLPFKVPAIAFLAIWFVQQALYGLASLGMDTNIDSGGVAYFAHVGGFVAGLICIRGFQVRRSPQPLF